MRGEKPRAEEPVRGVLVLAHGGNEHWNGLVLDLARRLEHRYLVDVAFGMADRQTITDGVDRLVRKGATQITAVSLFVSSFSLVHYGNEYLMGVRRTPPKGFEVLLQHVHGQGGDQPGSGSHAMSHHHPEIPPPIDLPVPVKLTLGLDDDPVVADILLDRARELSRQPGHEAVVVVAHGPLNADDNEKWLGKMRTLVEHMKQNSDFSGIEAITVRDDAPPPVRDQATAELRSLVKQKISAGKKVLIVPLLIAYGGIERGIEERLQGLDYVMSRQGLLPDARLADWVASQVEKSWRDAGSGK